MLQQGDVCIEGVSKIPNEAKKLNHMVLAEGEVTNHKHVVESGDAELLELGDRLFVRVLGGDVRVIHEEHKPITIPPGEYEVTRVYEYDHFAEESKAVAD